MRSPHATTRLARRVLLTLAALGILSAAGRAEEFVTRVPLHVPAPDSVIPDQFVVAFKRDVAHRLDIAADAKGRPRANLGSVQRALERAGAMAAEREFRGARPRPEGSRYPDLTGYYLVRIPAGADLAGAMAAMASETDVDHVEPIGVHPVDATPNDTYFAYGTAAFPYDQWHYWDNYGIDADLAWDLETGDPSVVVGILDTGMKYRHKELGGINPPGPTDDDTQGNVWVNPFEIPGNGIDDEGNGYIDDVIGWDFVSSAGSPGITCTDADCGGIEDDPNDGNGHGTHVSGTVAAITNNFKRVAGVAGGFSNGDSLGPGNGSKVMALRIGYSARVQGQNTGLVTMSWAAQAMTYVADMVDRGVDVAAINCSWGSSDTGGISGAVDNLLAHDVMIVNSAGNSNSSTAPFLATKAGVMAVGATDSTGVGTSFSNFGSWVDLAAPGDGILSTWFEASDPDTTHHYIAILSGTSMSAPHVCGVAALLESYNPALTRTDKFNLIVNNTSPFAPANTKLLGSGILNARNALLAAPAPVGVPDAPFPKARVLQLRASPNPARGGAELLVQAGSGERVRIAIVDAGGREVRTLEGVAPPGGGLRVRWDGLDARGRRAGTGLYLVSASSGKEHDAAKLVVLQ